VICRMVPFSMILNDPDPDFKVTPILDAEYVSNGTRYTYLGIQLIISNALLIGVILNSLNDQLSDSAKFIYFTNGNLRTPNNLRTLLLPCMCASWIHV